MSAIQPVMPSDAPEVASLLRTHNRSWQRAIRDNADGIVVNADGTLKYEDFQRIQEEIVRVRRLPLTGTMALMDAGLVRTEDMATTLAGYERATEFRRATVAMNPTAMPANTTTYQQDWTPLPLTFSGWTIPFRQLDRGYKESDSLVESVRQVGESIELIVWNGDPSITVNFDGSPQQLYGITNHPNRQTMTILNWADTDAATGVQIVDQTNEMLALLYENGAVVGPNTVRMFVANNVWIRLQLDHKTYSDITIKERIEQFSEIDMVQPAWALADGTVALVEMSSRTIQIVMASDIVTVPHVRISELDGQSFTTLAAMVAQIKRDANDRTGIITGAPSGVDAPPEKPEKAQSGTTAAAKKGVKG